MSQAQLHKLSSHPKITEDLNTEPIAYSLTKIIYLYIEHLWQFHASINHPISKTNSFQTIQL